MTGLCLKITMLVQHIVFCKMMKRWIFYLISQKMTGGKHEHGSCFKILHYHYGLLLLCLTGNMHRCILYILAFVYIYTHTYIYGVYISISAAKRKKKLYKVFDCIFLYLVFTSDSSQTTNLLQWMIIYNLTPIYFQHLKETQLWHSLPGNYIWDGMHIRIESKESWCTVFLIGGTCRVLHAGQCFPRAPELDTVMSVQFILQEISFAQGIAF